MLPNFNRPPVWGFGAKQMLLVNSAPFSGESWALAGESCEDPSLTTKLRVNLPK